jgi:hypothetical protein
VEEMTIRQKKRRNNNSTDKSTNPLVSIPGSPGSGKSTFLAHFPESIQYKSYINKREKYDPIVSILSYNNIMGKQYSSIGLRIIFGCAKSMNIIPFNWDLFCKQWNQEEANDCCAKIAIESLREFFGKERPVLLLIDELSKAKFDYDKIVMSDIGTLLDSYGDVDVIISSLSPT